MKRHRSVAVWAVLLALALVTAVAGSCRRDEPAQERGSVPASPRTIKPLPDDAFGVEWVANTVPKVMKAGAVHDVSVTFKNVGHAPWPDPKSTGNEPREAGAVRLAYRWWAPSSAQGTASVSRADFEQALQPGQAVTLKMSVTAPATPGDYRLQFDLVQELVTWFEKKDAARLLIPVRVR